MDVKVLIGDRRANYQLVLPVNSEVSDLSPEVRHAVGRLGNLRELGRPKLMASRSKLELETIDEIQKQGAHLWKSDIKFSESVSKAPA